MPEPRRFDWDKPAPKAAAKACILLLRAVAGDKYCDYWAWNMTPMPMGLPTWRHLWDGLMAVGPK